MQAAGHPAAFFVSTTQIGRIWGSVDPDDKGEGRGDQRKGVQTDPERNLEAL